MKTKMRLYANILALGLLPSLSFANDYSCDQEVKVLNRLGKSGYTISDAKIENLLCENGVATSFEGKNFKIVAGKNKEAIKFTDDADLVKKASNVYFHLEKSKRFWTNTIKSEYVANMKQLVIRVEINNLYSRYAHFMDTKNGESYNNAWTIAPGKTPRRARVQDEWGYEVWFAPPKKIPTSELINTVGNNPVSQMLRGLQGTINGEITDDMEREVIRRTIQDKPILTSSSFQDMFTTNVSFHIFYAIVLGIADKTDSWFYEDYFFIDSAMVPDIIYHEYGHVALSEKLPTRFFTPVIEGMADYFATRISDRPGTMFNKLGGISTNRPKNQFNNDMYDPLYENRDLSDRDFTISLLWRVRLDLEAENNKRVALGLKPLVDIDQLVYKSREYLDQYSDINLGLTRAMIQACRRVCERSSYISAATIIQRALEKKGL